jgi:hypothetical protein
VVRFARKPAVSSHSFPSSISTLRSLSSARATCSRRASVPSQAASLPGGDDAVADLRDRRSRRGFVAPVARSLDTRPARVRSDADSAQLCVPFQHRHVADVEAVRNLGAPNPPRAVCPLRLPGNAGRRMPRVRTDGSSSVRITDTEGRTLDGGCCTVAAEALTGAARPQAWARVHAL